MPEKDEEIRDLSQFRAECIESGQTENLGELLANKAIDMLFDYFDYADNTSLETALSFPETQEYLNNTHNLNTFAVRLAKDLRGFLRSGEESSPYRAAAVLKGENVKVMVIQKLDAESEGFGIIRDDVIYGALCDYLMTANPDVDDVSTFLGDEDYKRFISPEQTTKIVEEFAEHMMNRLEFDTLEERMDSEQFKHLFSDDLRERIEERKAIAEGRKEGEGQLRVPLHGWNYSTENEAAFREEVTYALDIAINGPTGFCWYSLMNNQEVHKYLSASQENRESFYDGVADILSKNATEYKKKVESATSLHFDDASIEINDEAKCLLIAVKLDSIKNYVTYKHFMELVASKCEGHPAYETIQGIIYDAAYFNMKSESGFGSNYFSPSAPHDTIMFYFSEEGMKKVSAKYLNELIVEGDVKKIRKGTSTWMVNDSFSREDVDDALSKAVDSGILSREKYDEFHSQ